MISRYDIPEPKRDETPTGKFTPPAENCEHDWLLVCQTCVDDSRQFKHQCKSCGKVTGAISRDILTLFQIQHAPPFDKDLYQRVYDIAYTAWKETAPKIAGERDARWWTWYDNYLDSVVWRQKAQLVLERCGNVCEACRLNPVDHIHHLTYAHVGAEPLFDLVGVCGTCHSNLHGRKIA